MSFETEVTAVLDTVEFNPPVFCITCKHIATNGSGDWERYKCMAPKNKTGVNLVTGESTYSVQFCKEARASTFFCGVVARWYEAAPPREIPGFGSPPEFPSIRKPVAPAPAPRTRGKIDASDL